MLKDSNIVLGPTFFKLLNPYQRKSCHQTHFQDLQILLQLLLSSLLQNLLEFSMASLHNKLGIKRLKTLNASIEKSDSLNRTLTNSKIKDCQANSPYSDPTIANFSTVIGISRTTINQEDERDVGSLFMNRCSLGCTSSGNIKQKNTRLVESFIDEDSESNSQSSEVLFIGSRDMTDKKLEELTQRNSYRLELEPKKQEAKNLGNISQKQQISKQPYQELVEKNKQLEKRNKELIEENAELRKRLEDKSRQNSVRGKYHVPTFIKERENKSKKTNNYSFNSRLKTLKPDNTLNKTIKQKVNMSSDSKAPGQRKIQIRATCADGSQLRKLMNTIQHEYSIRSARRNSQNI